jgi:xanthine dehydrogenase accessory factor
MAISVLLRGGGDLASGVALRLHRSGMRLLILELAQPLMVRRKVSFGEAVYAGSVEIEDVKARLVTSLVEAQLILEQGLVPVMIDPEARILHEFIPDVIVDGRMTKKVPVDLVRMEQRFELSSPMVIGLGPGFIAGQNCNAAIETRRGHYLGRVLWQGATESDTGIPEQVGVYREERVLRAPRSGILQALSEIGDHLEPGQPVAEIEGEIIKAPFKGFLRGLVHPGLRVSAGQKIGDIDPRDDPQMSFLVSEKSLAVGGGVLEAILSQPDLRKRLSV